MDGKELQRVKHKHAYRRKYFYSTNLEVIFYFMAVIVSNTVMADPEILNSDFWQGSVSLPRIPRGSSCTSRTGEEGFCTFAIDCARANGTHLGTCRDKFYFGSCCSIKNKTAINEFVDNIDAEPIDSVSGQVIKYKVQTMLNKATVRPSNTIKEKIPVEQSTRKDSKFSESTTTTLPSTTTIHQIIGLDIITGITENHVLMDIINESTRPSTNKVKPVSSTTKKTTAVTTTKPTTQKPYTTQKPLFANFNPFNILQNIFRPKPAFTLDDTIKLPYKPISSTTKKTLPLLPKLNFTMPVTPSSPKPLFTIPLNTVKDTVPETTSLPISYSTLVSMENSGDTATSIFNLLSNEIDEITENTMVNTSEHEMNDISVIDSVNENKITVESNNEIDIPVEHSPSLEIWSTTISSTTDTEYNNFYDESPRTTQDDSKITVSSTPSKLESEMALVPTKNTPDIFTTENEYQPTYDLQTATTEMDYTTESLFQKESLTTSDASNLFDTKFTDVPMLQISSKNKLPEFPYELTTIDTSTPSSLLTEDETESFNSLTTKAYDDFVEFTNLGMTTANNLTTEASITDIYTHEPDLFLTTMQDFEDSDTPSNEIDNEFESETEYEFENTTDFPYAMFDSEDVCGWQMWPSERIVGGRDTRFGQWPWTISLRRADDPIDAHLCGAALINENWAVTVAHCVIGLDPADVLLRLGEYNTSSDDEPYGYVERGVQLIASHPLFDMLTFENDLALLRFVERVPYQPNILPVCIPDSDDDFVGKTAHVTGWGRTSYGGPIADVMQEVRVPIITNSDCEAMYTKAGYNESVPHMFICAGYPEGGYDSCEGDSGGPMVVERESDGRFILTGIISWGIRCADPNKPGVYTRISDFRDWINQIVQF